MEKISLEQTFRIVEEQYLDLEVHWRVYQQVFASRKRDRDLLRDYLGSCAQVIKESLEDDLFIRIRRLFDRRRDVVSLWDLATRPPMNGYLGKRGTLQASIERIDGLAQKIICHTHKRIAHLDKDFSSRPLPKVLRRDFARLVRQIGNVVERARRVQQPGVAVGLPILNGDGETLLRQLRRVDGMMKLIISTSDSEVREKLKAIIAASK